MPDSSRLADYSAGYRDIRSLGLYEYNKKVAAAYIRGWLFKLKIFAKNHKQEVQHGESEA